MGIKILGTGSYLPEKVVTNEDIAKTLDTTDEWIYSHTGSVPAMSPVKEKRLRRWRPRPAAARLRRRG